MKAANGAYQGVTCAADGCPAPARSKTFCMPHYNRWRKYGDPLGSKPRVHTEAWKAKVSVAMKRHHAEHPEHKAAISAARDKAWNDPAFVERMSVGREREGNPGWAGDAVGYNGAHKRASKVLRRECTQCGTTSGLLDCALDHDAPAEFIRTSTQGNSYGMAFSIRVEDYMRLCRACHIQYDQSGLLRKRAL